MESLVVSLLLAAAALIMVFFTYFVCQAFFQMEEVLPRWAQQRGFRIVHREARTFFQGPFFWSNCPFNQNRPVYYVIIEDRHKRQRKGWVRLGWWYFVGFREKIEERWEE